MPGTIKAVGAPNPHIPNPTFQQVVDSVVKGSGYNNPVYVAPGRYDIGYGGTIICTVAPVTNPPDDYKTIPIPTVADKIYNIAKTGDNTSMLAVNEAVNNLISTGQLDVLLNNHIKSS